MPRDLIAKCIPLDTLFGHWIMLQVQSKFGDHNRELHKPGMLTKERLLPQRLVFNMHQYAFFLVQAGYIMYVFVKELLTCVQYIE